MKIQLFDLNFVGQKNVSPCIESSHAFARKTKDADFAIFTDNECFTKKVNSCELQKYAWLIEPPIVNGEMYINFPKISHKFSRVFSYNKWLEKRVNNFSFIPHGGTWLREQDIKIHPKHKLCSTILSKKEWNAGHRHRISIWNRLDKTRIDSFGSICGNRIENKIQGLQDYMFSIAMENESVPFLFDKDVHYFSEKILDCFLSGTIPIYLGNPHIIGNYFNKEGILCFNDYEDLVRKMNYVSESFYYKKIEAVKENFSLAQKYIHPEELIIQELQSLHSE